MRRWRQAICPSYWGWACVLWHQWEYGGYFLLLKG